MQKGAQLATMLIAILVALFTTFATAVLFFFATMAPGMPSGPWVDMLVLVAMALAFGVTFAVVFREMLGKLTR